MTEVELDACVELARVPIHAAPRGAFIMDRNSVTNISGVSNMKTTVIAND